MFFNKSSELECELWKIYVCEGIDGAMHGGFYPIKELHIPSLNASLNIEHNNINVLLNLKDRYKKEVNSIFKSPAPELINKVKLSKDLSKKIIKIVDNFKNLQKEKDESISELKSVLQ